MAKSDVVVVASPTYKATYTGLLKAFLDRYPNDGLARTVCIPVMTGAAPVHALAPEVHLRPLLVELGASTPTRGLFVTEQQFDDLDGVVEAWAATARPWWTPRRTPELTPTGSGRRGTGTQCQGWVVDVEQFLDLRRRGRPGEDEPLALVALLDPEPVQLVLLLDALCQRDQTERPTELDERMDEGRGMGDRLISATNVRSIFNTSTGNCRR